METSNAEREWLKYEQYIGCIISEYMDKNHPIREIGTISTVDLANTKDKVLVFGGAINDHLSDEIVKLNDITEPVYLAIFLPANNGKINMEKVKRMLQNKRLISESSDFPAIEYMDDEVTEYVNIVHTLLDKIYYNLASNESSI